MTTNNNEMKLNKYNSHKLTLTGKREETGKNNYITDEKNSNEMMSNVVEILQNLQLEQIEFPMMINGIQGPTLKIERLKDAQKQDVLNWTSKFRKIVELCEYSESVALQFLRLAVSDKYAELIESKKSLEQGFKSLIELAYNPQILKGFCQN